MTQKDPYQVVKRQHITEKAMMLQNLKNANVNRPKSLARCESPKYVFVVDRKANKQEIAQAVEEIYSARKIKVVAVNTINLKPKARRVRGHSGFTSAIKKAIVTLEKGDSLDDNEV